MLNSVIIRLHFLHDRYVGIWTLKSQNKNFFETEIKVTYLMIGLENKFISLKNNVGNTPNLNHEVKTTSF